MTREVEVDVIADVDNAGFVSDSSHLNINMTSINKTIDHTRHHITRIPLETTFK